MDRQVRTWEESNQARGSHFLEHRQMDKSGHRKNLTEQGALTNWSTDRWISQDTERIRLSEGHSLSGERRWTDKSGHGKNPTERGALTFWRAQTDGQVRTRKESNRVRGTHRLESAVGQDTERNTRHEKEGGLT